MAKTKKPIKAKEPIKIRYKQLANGNQSIYLDYYKDGRRQYEFLKLYIVPVKTTFDKLQNDEVLKSANAIKSQRIIELANGLAGLKQTKEKMLLADFMEVFIKRHLTEKTAAKQPNAIGKLLYRYQPKARLCDVDVEFCTGFFDFLVNTYKKKNGQPLKDTTIKSYATMFSAALNYAVRKDYIVNNPFLKLEKGDKITPRQTEREYLDINEIKALINTPCKSEITRRAFLFSCFCGLRYSDIKKLTWKDIKTGIDGVVCNVQQQKTGVMNYLPLSTEALKWLPKRANDDERIFELQEYSRIEAHIKKWILAAGIKKHVTFHTARHTFATMFLTLGADVYTVSKLLGHTNIQTTQIYAKIIDKKKQEAVNLANGIFD